jgi:hypothetical protein
MKEKKNLLLRLDPQLYIVLQRWADDELRSINAQIEYVLREAAIHAGRFRKSGDEAKVSDSTVD